MKTKLTRLKIQAEQLVAKFNQRGTHDFDFATNVVRLDEITLEFVSGFSVLIIGMQRHVAHVAYAVIGILSQIEATTSLLLVGQMIQTQRQQWHDKDKLDETVKAAEEFISKQSLEKGMAVVKHIHTEATPETARHNRRRKWTGWEI